MLCGIDIKHFTIVKELRIEFASGMTTLTGETGAGKSIMIDALELALGARADSSLIRHGHKKCEITASFNIAQQLDAQRWLDYQDIEHQGECILRRIITKDGSSKSYINGLRFPLQKVRELSELLINIHGQHQHQSLLRHEVHRQKLDNFAKNDTLRHEVKDAYQQWFKLNHQLQQLKLQESQSDRLALLSYQIEELHALELKDKELDALYEEHKNLHSLEELLKKSHSTITQLNAEDEPSALQLLDLATQSLQQQQGSDTPLTNALDLLTTARIHIEEAVDEISHFFEQSTPQPERLFQIEQRLQAISDTARKHRVDPNQLFKHQQSLEQELNQLRSNQQKIEQLQGEIDRSEAHYQAASLKLRQSREVAAKQLSREISSLISKLGMPEGKLLIAIEPQQNFKPHGLDKVEFMVRTNPGSPEQALAKIASGGELSRLGLAIQVLTAEREATPTLLFDEVDVGIGGAIAAMVGQLLRRLGDKTQVLCVTHQAQVAAHAHHHLHVEKTTYRQQTYSKITTLKPKQKVDEIARMLGGIQMTKQTLAHAEELLNNAKACV